MKTGFTGTFHNIAHLCMIISAILIILVGFYLVYEAYSHRTDYDDKVAISGKSDLAVAF